MGSSRFCLIIFAYGIVKCLSGKTLSTIWRIFYQYRPRFHTETRRADYGLHCDYIDYNSGRHGLGLKSQDWPFSRVYRFIRGFYLTDWGMAEIPIIPDNIGDE